MHRRLIYLLLVALLIIAACGGGDDKADDSRSATEPETPQEFIDALDAALTSGDQVVHMTVDISGQEAGEASAPYSTDEIWIYGSEERMRDHFQIDVNGAGEKTPQTIYLSQGSRLYSRSMNGQVRASDFAEMQVARPCPRVEPTVVSHYVTGIFCAVFTPQEYEVNELEARVESGVEFQGKAAIALVYEADNELAEGATPEPERAPDLTVSRFYIDADTRMPLGWTVEMEDAVEDLSVQITADYSNELVTRDELPADFFNPDWLNEAEETP